MTLTYRPPTKLATRAILVNSVWTISRVLCHKEEVGNQYLGRLARLARDPEALALLNRLAEPAEFTELLERFGE